MDWPLPASGFSHSRSSALGQLEGLGPFQLIAASWCVRIVDAHWGLRNRRCRRPWLAQRTLLLPLPARRWKIALDLLLTDRKFSARKPGCSTETFFTLPDAWMISRIACNSELLTCGPLPFSRRCLISSMQTSV